MPARLLEAIVIDSLLNLILAQSSGRSEACNKNAEASQVVVNPSRPFRTPFKSRGVAGDRDVGFGVA